MGKISTQNLKLLPAGKELQKLCKSISALEAIICTEWEYRYYSYNKDWSEKEEFFEMRNGSGDQMLILFNAEHVVINGFAHESEMNGWKTIIMEGKQSFIQKLLGLKKEKTESVQEIWSGVVDQLPEVFNEFIWGEPVKSIGTTFCIWQTKSDSEWEIGKIGFPKNDYTDGSRDLLQLLDGNPLTYKTWAEEYYEETFEDHELKLELVGKVFNGTMITRDLVNQINPELEDFDQLKSDLNAIGYEYNL